MRWSIPGIGLARTTRPGKESAPRSGNAGERATSPNSGEPASEVDAGADGTGDEALVGAPDGVAVFTAVAVGVTVCAGGTTPAVDDKGGVVEVGSRAVGDVGEMTRVGDSGVVVPPEADEVAVGVGRSTVTGRSGS
ncbi:MAG: hypothetical protein ACOC5M_03425 [Chloroflexota bacterium]